MPSITKNVYHTLISKSSLLIKFHRLIIDVAKYTMVQSKSSMIMQVKGLPFLICDLNNIENIL